jgi:TPR repeat protein
MKKYITLLILLSSLLFATQFDKEFDNSKTKQEKCQLAKKWAKKGDGRALYILGASYYYGDLGLCNQVRDFNMSFHYLKKSYDIGYIFSSSLLAEHYENGYGTKKNKYKAFQIAKNGYQKNDLEATMLYAYYRCTGYGADKDCTEGKNIMRNLLNSNNQSTVFRAKDVWKNWKFNEL